MTRLLALPLMLALFAPTAALAQDPPEPPPVEVDIVGGGVKSNVAIAVPAVPASGGA